MRRTMTLSDLSDSKSQDLPLDERSPEDQKAIQLMKVRGFLLSVLNGSVTMPLAGPELEKMS